MFFCSGRFPTAILVASILQGYFSISDCAAKTSPESLIRQDVESGDYRQLCFAIFAIEMIEGPKLIGIPTGTPVVQYGGDRIVKDVLPVAESDEARAKYLAWLVGLEKSHPDSYRRLADAYLADQTGNLDSPHCTLLGALKSVYPDAVYAGISFTAAVDNVTKTPYVPEGQRLTKTSVFNARTAPIKYLESLTSEQRERLDRAFRKKNRLRARYFTQSPQVIFRYGRGIHNTR